MGLWEFLRQWQRGRLSAGVVVSVLLHVALIGVLLGGRLPMSRYDVKRGEPLIVELPRAEDSPPPGLAGVPEPSPAAPPTPAARTVAPAPPPSPPQPPAPKAVAKPAPRPAERPAPRPEPERRVASAPVPKAPDGQEPAPAPAAPPKPEAPPAEQRPASERPIIERTPQERPPAERQVASLPPPSAPGAPDIRTALRRGQGGSGGSGEGRAGIEGEPIPLDSANPKYSDYLDQVRRRIKDKWGFPCVKNETTRQCEYKTTQLVIEFGIAKDGKVPFVNVLRSSGYPIYDDYAVNAVKLASPFPPIPDTFSKKGVPIHATFSYVVESSLANILR
ncbi:MAG TPA: TonB family protein [Methylomirabilota bacterium]|jgi:TonB family protein|nr:TonB family protein [Methylomirabilota bacterium]